MKGTLNYTKKKQFYLINKKKFKSFIILIHLIYLIGNIKITKKFRKIGVIGLNHSQNVGNNLLKYAMYIKLSEFGFKPCIIGKQNKNSNISFILNTVNARLITKSFDEINENDYDILMVNSDQTWRKDNEYINVGFLNFAKNWNKPKFVYGASLGVDYWQYTKSEDNILKSLIKNFTGISIREIGSIKYIESHLGIKPILVLDPTFLIDKKYYLNLIKNFKIENVTDNNFIFIYTLTESNEIKVLKDNINKKYKYKFYIIDINVVNQIQKFLYGIYKSKAVITDSFHGTVFSIIFNKPFISFVYNERGKERFNSLKEIFNISNRIYNEKTNPDIDLIETPLNINKKIFNHLKRKSLHFLKNNLFFKLK